MLNDKAQRVFGRPSRQWRGLAVGAVLVSGWLMVAVVSKKTGLSVIFGLSIGPLAFVSGYLYRAHLVANAKRPPVGFLRVAGDDEGDRSE